MLILMLRTDKPESEVGLYEDQEEVVYETWQAHRQLAETIHNKIEELLKRANKKLSDIEGVVCYEGPGSFTGLRIGISVANALVYSLNIPGVTVSGDEWQKKGTKKLMDGEVQAVLLPEYGGQIHITKPKK